MKPLIVSPSSSPENCYIHNGEKVTLCAGCEADNQILRKLFDSTIKAAEILKKLNHGVTQSEDETYFDAEQFLSILDRIAMPAIHSNGSIREWNEEYEEAEPGHRHFSHLFALYPGDAISSEETPGLAAAARKTIELRLAADGGHTGWSRSWLINFFACLKDGEASLEHLNALFKDFTLPNLFNSHPPFQIDGNFGSLSGITQMLFQSRIRYKEDKTEVTLNILPALPEKWHSGSIRGVRAKGNLELDFEWKNNELISLIIKNKGSKDINVILTANQTNKHELILKNSSLTVNL